MAKKTTVITRQEIEGEQEVLPPENQDPIEIDADAAELAEFLNNLGGSANRVKIFKIENGERAYCGSAELSVVNEDYILKNYRGGKYLIMATLNGQYVKGGSRQITIYEPPVDPFDLRPKAVDNSMDGQIAILQDQIRRQHEMLLQVMQAGQGKQPSIGEVISIVRDMQAMTKPPDMMAVLPSLMGLFKDTMELARETAGVSDGKTDWMALIGKAMDKLPAIVGQIAMSRMTNPAAGAVPVATAEESQSMKLETMLKRGIEFLKEKAIKNKDPELQADLILDNFDDPQYRILGTQLMNMPFEDFGKLDPEILNEPLRSWFLQVYNRLKEGISHVDTETDVISGQDGSDANPAGDEKNSH
jgi:hypothetical protein